MKHAEKQKFKQPEEGFFASIQTVSANVNCEGLIPTKNQFLPRLRSVKMKKSTSVNINAQ
jgi:hypothetical protein